MLVPVWKPAAAYLPAFVRKDIVTWVALGCARVKPNVGIVPANGAIVTDDVIHDWLWTLVFAATNGLAALVIVIPTRGFAPATRATSPAMEVAYGRWKVISWPVVDWLVMGTAVLDAQVATAVQLNSAHPAVARGEQTTTQGG